MITIITLIGCIANSDVHKPQTISFNPTYSNQAFTMDLKTLEPRSWSVTIHFYQRDPKTKKELMSYENYLSHFIYNQSNHIVAPITCQIKIINEKNQVILNKTVDNPKAMPSYFGRSADLTRLTGISLDKGNYKIIVTYINGSKKLNNLRSVISVHETGNGAK